MKPHFFPPKHRQIRWITLFGVLATTLTGCHQPQRRYKPAVLATRSDVAGYVREALEYESADARRAAVEQIAKTRHAGLPMVIDALALVARTDTSSSVRCAAVRALEEQDDAKSLDTMVVLLSESHGETPVRAADAAVHWEAMKALCARQARGTIQDAVRPRARAAAIYRLGHDPSRDVRIAAAEFLGYDADAEVLAALIDALRQADFGVQYAAERSLMRLTGVSHDYDPARWRTWLDSTADPFAGRGQLDEQLDGSKKGIWPFSGA